MFIGMKSIRLLRTLYGKLSNTEHLQFHCKATAFINDMIDILPDLQGRYDIYASMYHQEYITSKQIHFKTDSNEIVRLKNLERIGKIRPHTDWAYMELVKDINTLYHAYLRINDKKDEQNRLSILTDQLNALTNETERAYAYRSYHKNVTDPDNSKPKNKPYQMTIYEQSLAHESNQMRIKTTDVTGFGKALYKEALSAIINTGTEAFPNLFTVVGFCNNNDNLPNGLLLAPTSGASLMDKLQGVQIRPVALIKDGRILARIFGLINPEMLP